ncbi:hypothetical protein JCM8097_007745 [Rhodosporidiobolus ruineniae]
MFSRACSACVRSVRLASRPTALPTVVAQRPLHAFAPTPPGSLAFPSSSLSPLADPTPDPAALKKASKKAAASFEDEFEEDLIEDDGIEDLPSQEATPSAPAGSRRAERYAAALAAVQSTLRQSDHTLATQPPSQRQLLQLLQQASAGAELDQALQLVQRWRARGLDALKEKTVVALARQLNKTVEADGGKTAVEVFADRTRYGADVPRDLKSLYGLFSKLSRPEPEPAAAIQGAEDAAESTAPSSSASSSADLIYSLYNTALLHRPLQVAHDPLVLLTTLSALARAGKLSSSRSEEVIARIQKTGEEVLVQRTREALGSKARDVVRMRSRVVALKMKEEGHAEEDFFSHLAESIHGVAAK